MIRFFRRSVKFVKTKIIVAALLLRYKLTNPKFPFLASFRSAFFASSYAVERVKAIHRLSLLPDFMVTKRFIKLLAATIQHPARVADAITKLYEADRGLVTEANIKAIVSYFGNVVLLVDKVVELYKINQEVFSPGIIPLLANHFYGPQIVEELKLLFRSGNRQCLDAIIKLNQANQYLVAEEGMIQRLTAAGDHAVNIAEGIVKLQEADLNHYISGFLGALSADGANAVNIAEGIVKLHQAKMAQLVVFDRDKIQAFSAAGIRAVNVAEGMIKLYQAYQCRNVITPEIIGALSAAGDHVVNVAEGIVKLYQAHREFVVTPEIIRALSAAGDHAVNVAEGIVKLYQVQREFVFTLAMIQAISAAGPNMPLLVEQMIRLCGVNQALVTPEIIQAISAAGPNMPLLVEQMIRLFGINQALVTPEIIQAISSAGPNMQLLVDQTIRLVGVNPELATPETIQAISAAGSDKMQLLVGEIARLAVTYDRILVTPEVVQGLAKAGRSIMLSLGENIANLFYRGALKQQRDRARISGSRVQQPLPPGDLGLVTTPNIEALLRTTDDRSMDALTEGIIELSTKVDPGMTADDAICIISTAGKNACTFAQVLGRLHEMYSADFTQIMEHLVRAGDRAHFLTLGIWHLFNDYERGRRAFNIQEVDALAVAIGNGAYLDTCGKDYDHLKRIVFDVQRESSARLAAGSSDGPVSITTPEQRAALVGLNLDPTQASVPRELIVQAYKRLALQRHPDKNRGRQEAAAEEFKKIGAAYALLLP